MTATPGILLVEDDADLAALLEKHLRRAGLEVICRDRVETALECLANEVGWLAAVVDLTLPGQPGTELVNQILTRYPNLAVIAISGSPSHPAVFSQNSTAAPRLRFLQKPFAPKDLLQAIGELQSSGGPAPAASD